MNSGATTERVYDALRHRLLNHHFRPGDRLDPTALAEPLASSVTPVRDALHLLVGETLVETHSGTGFYVPMLDEPLLKDLYDWAHELVGMAIRGWPKRTPGNPDHETAPPPAAYAERSAVLFQTIGRRSLNGEHTRAIDRLNARLHAVRTVEPGIIQDAASELAAVEGALAAGDRDGLRRLSGAYHRRRRRAAAAIVRATYRAD